MAHQHMPKILNGPHKNPPPPTSYILSVRSLITFFINGNPVFNNGPRSLPRTLPDCIILDN